MTLNEGLAYAIAPGLFAWGASKTVLEDAAASAAPRSSYRGFYEVAIGIQPALQERAWNRAATPADFAALLDAGCAAWKGRAQPPG